MNTNSNIIFGLITGAAIGTIAAILYAPEKGSDMRRKIADSAQIALDSIARAAEELKGKAASVIEEEAGNLEDKLSSLIARAHHKPEELITLLEAKLQDLKKKAESKKVQGDIKKNMQGAPKMG